MQHPRLPATALAPHFRSTETPRLVAPLSVTPPVKISPAPRLVAPLLAAGRKHRGQLLALALPVLATPAMAQFNQTGAGPFEYTDTANWTGGTITNVFGSNPAADQVVTFGADYTTVDPDGAGSATATLSIANTGTFNRTFRGTGGDRTLTLGGNISLGSSTTNLNTVTFGSTTSGEALNIALGANRTITTGTNRTLDLLNIVSGTGFGVTKQGVGTLKLSNIANTYTGVTSIGASGQPGGVLEVTKLANGGVASSIGASANTHDRLVFGGNATGTLRYVGSGDSTDRRFLIGGVGAIFDSSGTGALVWTNTSAPNYASTGNPRTITFAGTNTDGNSMAAAFNDSGAGLTSILKQGTGRWIIAGTNTYTGTTTVDAGTLELGAANRIADTSALVLNGGTFATGGFSETFATLDLNGNATLDLGSGASDLVFADSSAVAWGASISLSVINFTEGVDTIRIGTTNLGLAIDQLGKITINGFAAEIDAQGYLSASAIPEPSSAALLAGLGGLGIAALRRRRLRS